MLKQQPISLLRRRSGGVILTLLIATATGAAYAATTPVAAAHADPGVMPSRYSLNLDVSFDGKAASQHFKLCLKPGEYAHVNGVSTDVPAWSGRIAVLPAAKGQLEVRGDLSGGSLDKAVHPIVRTLPGQKATIMVGRQVADRNGDAKVAEGETSIKLDMTPSIGC